MTRTAALARLALDENLPDERSDGLDGIRHGEESDERQARVRQAPVHAFADRPDLVFAGKSGQGLDRKISHHVIELAHQSLIGTEHDRTDAGRIGTPVHLLSSALLATLSRKQTLNPSSTVR